LKTATPDGVDGYSENVGGEVLDATLMRMNPFGRIRALREDREL
jgi:NADPH-dependent curcumin reductase